MGIRRLAAGALATLALPATALAVATPVGPANGAKLRTASVQWTLAAGDHAKEVQLATSSARIAPSGSFVEDNVVAHATVGDADTTWTWPSNAQERLFAGRYYWLVKTQDDSAVTAYSAARSFVLKAWLRCSPPRAKKIPKKRAYYVTATCNTNARSASMVFVVKLGTRTLQTMKRRVSIQHAEIPTNGSVRWYVPATVPAGAKLKIAETITAGGIRNRRSITFKVR